MLRGLLSLRLDLKVRGVLVIHSLLCYRPLPAVQLVLSLLAVHWVLAILSRRVDQVVRVHLVVQVHQLDPSVRVDQAVLPILLHPADHVLPEVREVRIGRMIQADQLLRLGLSLRQLQVLPSRLVRRADLEVRRVRQVLVVRVLQADLVHQSVPGIQADPVIRSLLSVLPHQRVQANLSHQGNRSGLVDPWLQFVHLLQWFLPVPSVLTDLVDLLDLVVPEIRVRLLFLVLLRVHGHPGHRWVRWALRGPWHLALLFHLVVHVRLAYRLHPKVRVDLWHRALPLNQLDRVDLVVPEVRVGPVHQGFRLYHLDRVLLFLQVDQLDHVVQLHRLVRSVLVRLPDPVFQANLSLP